MKKFLIVFAALLPLIFAGCKGGENLDGKWVPVSMTQNGKSYEIESSCFVDFSTSGSKIIVSGNSGVNLLNGEIKIGEGSLTSNGFASTRMMGTPTQMAFEDAFLEIFSYATSYELKDGSLKIVSAEKNGEIVFEKAN